MSIQILLATYNSEKHLSQQLDSILSQDYGDFQILLRDAGSEDGTLEIISNYEKQYPEKIILKEVGRADACRNFSRLLELSDADIIMFSDHDDVWLPNKVSMTLAKYQQAEDLYGKDTPILVFTDSVVVNENLEKIRNSHFIHQNLNPQKIDFISLSIQNCASGNTILLNRSLKEKAVPIPQEAVMHDHFLMLTAAALGKIVLLDEPTLLYRQHTKNVLGAANYGFFYFLRLIAEGKENSRGKFYRHIRQAIAFYQLHKEEIPQELLVFLSELQNFQQLGFLQKRQFLLRYRLFKSGFLRNLGMFLVI